MSEIAARHHSYSGRLYNVLKEFKANNPSRSNGLPLSEADAWALYELTVQELENTTYKELKEKHGLSKTYGWGILKLMPDYYIAKGILEEDSHFPFPKDFQ